MIIKKLFDNKDTKIGKFMAFAFFSLLIMMLTEAYQYNTYLYIFVLFFNVEKLVNNSDKININN